MLRKNSDSIDAEVVILGGGLAGLSAAYILSQSGRDIVVLEKDSTVGGLAKTIVKNQFRFDLGGHRFVTQDEHIERFVKDLMDGELEIVPRSSKIYLRNSFFDYPLNLSNAILGLGIPLAIRILADYVFQKIKNQFRRVEPVSLEDRVVADFGRTMFNIYFKEYSEKVWGIDSSRISAKWVDRRIQGLSLGITIKNAFFKPRGNSLPTLAGRFLYPSSGIGRISEKLRETIEQRNQVFTGTSIERLHHQDFQIKGVEAKNGEHTIFARGQEFVSSIPITTLVKRLHPKPPGDVLEAASKLRYRALVVVSIMVDRKRVTDLTWIYLPEGKLGPGRLHEPKNWSRQMAPEDQTLLVAEYFCFMGDETWEASDEQLTANTVQTLEDMGFIQQNEVIDSVVVRVPEAYPLLEIGYEWHLARVWQYLEKFENLELIGRSGSFQYLNMDHVMGAGIDAAQRLLAEKLQRRRAK